MDSNNTHGAAIIGENFTAFIDGVPDTCNHDSKGDRIYQSASGKMIYWHTYRQWASYCSDLRGRLIHEYHIQIEDPIVMGCVSCSKCKKPFFPPLY